MSQSEGRQWAADAVAAELAERGWSNADLSQATVEPGSNESPVDLGTIGDFLNYKRWPKARTQGRIEKAFGWPAGTIRLISVGKVIRPARIDLNGPVPPELPELTASAVDPLEIEDDAEAMQEFLRQRAYRKGKRDVGADT